jgi:hypothetical protein
MQAGQQARFAPCRHEHEHQQRAARPSMDMLAKAIQTQYVLSASNQQRCWLSIARSYK